MSLRGVRPGSIERASAARIKDGITPGNDDASMFEFALPDLGTGVTEGEILAWHVEPGEAVAADDILLEVETEKAVVDVPSPVAGALTERRAEVGDVVETGTTIATIDTEGAAADTAAEAAADDKDTDAGGQRDDSGTDGEADATPTDTGARVFAPPSVRRLARELDVDVAAVAGSGPSGRVTEDDVRGAAAEDAGDDGKSGTSDAEDASRELKSAVRRVGEDESADEAGGTAAEDYEEEPTSVVSRVDAGDASPEAESERDEADEDPAAAEEPAVKSAVRAVDRQTEREQTLATPATRRLARELGVDVDAVPTDVTRDGEPFVDEAAVRSFAERGAGERPTAGVESSGEALDTSVAHTEDYRGVRRELGERMATSRREIPHATHHDRADVSELVAARKRLEPLAENRGVDLTYTPFILKCVAAALKDHPVLNTRIDADAEKIHYLDEYHLGVATDTDRGLLVPVLQDVDGRGIVDLARATNDLLARAREGSIDPSEMTGGTFTVSNVGAIGGEYADPIITVPQTAVLSVGALRDRPVAIDGEVEAKPTLPLSLAFDHRVIDSADAARFTNTLKTYLADPTRLLLE